MPPRIATTLTQQALVAAFGARLFAAHEAAQLGITRRQIECAVEAGTLVRVHHGRYTAVDVTPRLRLRALQSEWEGRGVPAVGGARSAADIWTIPVLGKAGPLPPSTPTLWIPPGTARPGERGGVHYLVGNVPDEHMIRLSDGLVVTSPLRTAVDVVRLSRLPRRLALATIVGGMRAHTAYAASIDPRDAGTITQLVQDPDVRADLTRQLAAVAARCPSWGMSSVRACLSVADPRLENALEAISFGRFLDAGVPLPVPQVWLQGVSGRWWRVDFWWDAFGIIGEADGMVKYANRQDLLDEKSRQLDLEAPGRSLHRWGWGNAIRDDDPLMGQFVDLLRQ